MTQAILIEHGHDGNDGYIIAVATTMEDAVDYIRRRFPHAERDQTRSAFWTFKANKPGNNGRWIKAENTVPLV